MTKNERFKDARLKSGKSQQEIADLIGVSQAYIAGIEKKQAFSLKKAKLLAPLVGIDGEWLYFGDKLSQESNIEQELNINQEAKESTSITLREPDEVNQKSNFHLGGGGSEPTRSKELLQLINNQQKQIDLLYQSADLLRNQVTLLNNLILK